MILKSFRFVLVLLIVSLLGVGLAWGEQKKVWKIGVAVSLTGVFGKDGSLVKDAYTLWQETINAAGGINGSPVEIIFYDDQHNEEQR